MIVIVGGSMTGKTHLQKEIAKDFGYERFVTITTRSPRAGEVEGEDYYFVTDEIFDQWNREGLCAEDALYGEHRYSMHNSMIDWSYTRNLVAVLTQDGIDFLEGLGYKALLCIKMNTPRIQGDRELPEDFVKRLEQDSKLDSREYSFRFDTYPTSDQIREVIKKDQTLMRNMRHWADMRLDR